MSFYFLQNKNTRWPKYLCKLIPLKNNTYYTRSTHLDGIYYCRRNAFQYSFFPYTIREWNKLDLQLRNAEPFKKFINNLLKLGRPTLDLIYRIHCPLGLKLLTSTAQKMKFSIKGFFSKCDQIRRKLRIWSHLLKKSLMTNFIFCEV